MGGSGRGVFLLEQQRKDALFLLSRPVLETTLASLECIWRSCQGRYTSCPRLTFLSPCLLHTFTQHSLWYQSKPYYAQHSALSRFITLDDRMDSLYYDATQ